MSSQLVHNVKAERQVSYLRPPRGLVISWSTDWLLTDGMPQHCCEHLSAVNKQVVNVKFTSVFCLLLVCDQWPVDIVEVS